MKNKTKQYDVIVIGAGAAGLMSAICAAKQQARCCIIEHKDVAGKKIYSTGNGRCNYTNQFMDVSCFYGENPSFVVPIINRFSPKDTIAFFKELGIYPLNHNGYLYPQSQQASSIVDVLLMEVRRLDVSIRYQSTLQDVSKKNDTFFVTLSNGETLLANTMIWAVGGLSSPNTGSDGSSYKIIQSFGHTIIPQVPALVPLFVDDIDFKLIAGVRTRGHVSIYVDQTCFGEDEGEVQLTNQGISGIPVFQISRHATKALKQGKKVTAHIDFFPMLHKKAMEDELFERFYTYGWGKSINEALIGLLNEKLLTFLLKKANINGQEMACEISSKNIKRLVTIIKGFEVSVIGSKDFQGAQVTAGGIDTSQLMEDTLMSKKCPGMFFAGEVIDVDGICGGYNLQWAWSTGYIAGNAAAAYQTLL